MTAVAINLVKTANSEGKSGTLMSVDTSQNIVRITPEQRDLLANVKALVDKAYTNNNTVTWLLGKRANDRQKAKGVIYYLMDDAARYKYLITSQNGHGVTIYNYSTQKMKLTQMVRFIAFVLQHHTLGTFRRFIIREKLTNKRRLKIPHIYCGLLASSRDDTGFTGIHQVKDHLFELSRKEQLPILAEATEPRVIAAYKRYGFEEYDHLTLPGAPFEKVFLIRKPEAL